MFVSVLLERSLRDAHRSYGLADATHKKGLALAWLAFVYICLYVPAVAIVFLHVALMQGTP